MSSESKKGFTKFNNDFLEWLYRQKFSGSEFRVLLAHHRRTAGYHKEEDTWSKNQMVEWTGLSERGVSKAMEKLCKRGLFEKRKSGYLVSKKLIVPSEQLFTDTDVRMNDCSSKPMNSCSPSKDIYKEKGEVKMKRTAKKDFIH